MRKILTELHLLMERADLVYIADEIVKHYNLPTKVKFKQSFRRKKNKDKGTYDWENDIIYNHTYELSLRDVFRVRLFL